ncbi:MULTISPECIES: hypothetical protein [Paenibacillus]|uniref:hypothetical protein n=1 Tax=Paenibacillus TaxID=44249 RepID=UPI000D433621|nr:MULTISPECIES: hypothetical protein [Paenibacillus]KAF6614307.1 hypothetical protein HFE00_25570 [Paenibacillus sp. EKM101P]KAF6616659.1 hypothetical protein HFE03_25370 [Paenibacillus sp. EKM102P]KAF6625113.1 hypothetical protein HFE01_25670 [Paenibacillus sp. EKM10P]KAF6640972.1 hypothetical protein HFE02_25680 [Paenibacillus sp. EKM11P]PTU44257.1 hypothetical protein DBL67_24295 [Paenibacillus polymyxa]
MKKLCSEGELLRIELLSRLGEPKESIYAHAWEKEAWAVDAERSGKLVERLNLWETENKQGAHARRC